MNELVENNLNLVHEMLKRFYPPNSMYDYDDLFQIGCIGLFKASQKFDALKGLKFSTLACRCIIHEVVREIRYQNTPLRKVDDPLYLQHEISHDSELSVMIGYAHVEDQVINTMLVEELIEAEPVIIPLMLEGYNRYQIAKKLKCKHVNMVWRKVNRLKEVIS
jgi:RNA polymerase sporulation-specific sigma factor